MRRGRTRRGIASRLLRATVVILLAAIVGLYVALPYVVQQLLPPLFARHGVRFSVDAVEHDILGAQLVLKGVRISREQPLLKAREAVARADLKALLGGALRLKVLTLSDGELLVRKGPQGGWRVGGLALSAPDIPLRTGVGRLELRDFAVRYAGAWSEDLYLEKAVLKDIALEAAGVPISFELDGVMGQGRIAASGRAWPTLEEPMLDAELSLAQIPIESVAELFAAMGLPLRQGLLGAEVRLRMVSAAGDGGRVADVDGEVQFSGVKGQARQVLLRDGDLLWRGQARFVLPVSEGPAEQRLRGRVTAGHLSGELAPGPAPGAGQPFRVQDAAWEGRIKWEAGADSVERLGVNGDAKAGRLVFADRNGRVIALEQVAVWGVEQRLGERLGVGRVQAQGAYGAGMAGAGVAASRVGTLRPDTAEWRAARLEAEGLELSGEGRIDLASVDLEDVQLNPVGEGRPGFVRRARLERLGVNEGRLRASSVGVEGLKLEGREPGGEDALELDLAVLLDLAVPVPNRVQIGEARLSRVRAGLVREADGAWRGLPLPGSEEDTRLTLGLLRLAGTNRIAIADFSVDPPYRVTLDPLDGWLAGWDSLEATDGGRFTVDTSVGEGGTVEASGRLGPTAGPLELAVHAELSAVRLVDLPGVVTAAIAGDTHTGRVAGEIDLDLGRDGWQAQARLHLSGLAASDGARPAVGFVMDERHGMRVDLRLDARRGEESLEGPLKAGFRRATAAAIVDYYGSLGVTAAGADAALRKGRLALKPVGYVPGSASFDRNSASYLETLADRMNHRPLTRVKVCALSVMNDFIRTPTEGGPPPVDLGSKGKALAGLRDSFIRDHLTGQLGLSRIRLLPCEPSFDGSPGAEPRVELTLEVAR